MNLQSNHDADPSSPSSPKRLAANTVGYDRVPDGGTTTTWLTPPNLIHGDESRSYTGLGPFDLDPCTPEEGMPWPTASRLLKPSDDGLQARWPKDDFVFMNPPFGRGQDDWMKRMANHQGGGIALVFSRTETRWFQRFVLNCPSVSAVVFQQGRLAFCRADGVLGKAPPCGAVWIGYGEEGARRLRRAVAEGQIPGFFLDMARVGRIAVAHVKEATNDD